MTKIKRIIVLCLLFAVLCGCSQRMKNDEFFAMDTYMSISLNGDEEDIQAVKEEIYRLDALLGWDSMDISDPELKSLAEESKKISEFTNGAFDITVAPLLEIWGFRSKNYKIPSSVEIQKALDTVGYNKESENRQFDFGAVAKGYAGDKIRQILIHRGVESAIVSLGGNVVAIGRNNNGRLWKVGIKDPQGQGYIGYVEVEDACVVTSGGYERFFESDGKRYSHIINPKTGWPAGDGIGSVTVVSENGTLADALSTAFYVMGKDATQQFCKSCDYKMNNSSFSVIFIDAKGGVSVFGSLEFEERE